MESTLACPDEKWLVFMKVNGDLSVKSLLLDRWPAKLSSRPLATSLLVPGPGSVPSHKANASPENRLVRTHFLLGGGCTT